MSLDDPSQPCNCRLGVKLKPRTRMFTPLRQVKRLLCSLCCTLFTKSPFNPPRPHLKVVSAQEQYQSSIISEGVWRTTGCSRSLGPLFELSFARFRFSLVLHNLHCAQSPTPRDDMAKVSKGNCSTCFHAFNRAHKRIKWDHSSR